MPRDYPHARCRSFGHVWDEPYIDNGKDREHRARGGQGRKVFQNCLQCPTKRYGFIDYDGNLEGGHWYYQYPLSYAWGAGDIMPKRSGFRADYLRARGLLRRRR